MDEKIWAFSLPTLFIVTGLSFLFFNFIIIVLDGGSSPLLSKIGIGSCILGVLTWLLIKVNRYTAHKN